MQGHIQTLTGGLRAVWDGVSGRGYMRRNGLGIIEDHAQFDHYDHLNNVRTRLANIRRLRGIRDFLHPVHDHYFKNDVPSFAAMRSGRVVSAVGGLVAGAGVYVFHRVTMTNPDAAVTSLSVGSSIHGLAYIFSGVTGALNLHARHVVHRAKLDRQTDALQRAQDSAPK